MTPFHNMALMCPATTEADVDHHTRAFSNALDSLFPASRASGPRTRFSRASRRPRRGGALVNQVEPEVASPAL